MGIPYFFQKFQYDLIILGLPGVGKKLFMEEVNTKFSIKRADFLIDISSKDSSPEIDYKSWIDSLKKRNIIDVAKISGSREKISLEFKNRKEIDRFLELILIKNGGISLNTAVPEGLAWNPEFFPPAIIVSAEDYRFKLETNKGKWLVSFRFSPGNIKNIIHFPEDKIKMREFCKKNNIDIYDVPFFENQMEMSYENWDKLAESLLN